MTTPTLNQPPADTEPRALRADARRNRAKVLDAARREFATHGLEAQMDDIARRAKVGVGTVYRHFPNKVDLLQALADEKFQGLADAARAGLAAEDPWEGFVGFMTYAARTMADDRSLAEAMGQHPGLCAAAAERADLDQLNAELVARVQAAGRLRPDVVPEDIPALVCGIGRAVDAESGEPSMPWDRYLQIILAGLSAQAA
ncbi:MAG TPA: helix-turn-helix domain-containing protein [Solirubrobacterales bacterium]|nr:helix-turn-helix domain-containing protein [Solirubrobacterales bacterium]